MLREIFAKFYASVPCVVAVATSAIAATSDPASSYTEQTLHLFCAEKNCRDGALPGEIVADAAGNLFGTTGFGGKNNAGAIYEFALSTGQYSILYNFCSRTNCADGAQPDRVSLVIDTAGNLYGTTERGGNSNAGIIFEVFRKGSGWREKTLYVFCSEKDCKDGNDPRDGLTYFGANSGSPYDGVSPLYGTTYYRGATEGTVFSIAPKSGTKKWVEHSLYKFCSESHCADGANPDTPLHLDAQGDIFGTTFYGGKNNRGTVFELTPTESTYSETVLYSFCSETKCADGSGPLGGVVLDQSGNVYGTTAGGGPSDDGSLFRLSFSGSQWNYTNLADFNGKDGASPESQLWIDSNGNLFGTTYGGGAHEEGTVFEYNGTMQTLYSFCPQHGCEDGANPISGLVEDSSGNLYGVALEGGRHGNGTIYKLSP